MSEFFSICEYFGITPMEFFDEQIKNPELIQKVIKGLKQLDEDDMILILTYINRLQKK